MCSEPREALKNVNKDTTAGERSNMGAQFGGKIGQRWELAFWLGKLTSKKSFYQKYHLLG